MQDNWFFVPNDAHLAKEPIPLEMSWKPVSVPHSWNVLDGSDGGGYYRGIGWYRHWLVIPKEEDGRSLFLNFGAVSMVSDIYINGEWVMKHNGGFAAFTVNITPFVRFGEKNLIAVKASNATRLNIPPLYAEFTFSGGMYRSVTAISTSPLHLELAPNGWQGVQFNQRLVTAEVADIDTEISVSNDTMTAARAQIVVSVRDATGTVVTTAQRPVEVAAQRTTSISVPLRVEKPHRWHGTRDPYLYEAVVQVRVDGMVIDEVRKTIGLRSMQIDPAQGFLLNGEPYDLHGVAMHQDRLGKGWIVSSEDRREDLALLQELGVTFVRLVHYQHDQEVYDLMDRAGIIVWAELPVLMQVGRYPIFLESAKTQLTELIRQNAHHPSIVCWGLYNEIGNVEEDRVAIRELHALAKKLDPIRPTAGASYVADAAKINFITDIISFNKYFGWFLPNINAFGAWADQFHRLYPRTAVGITEYGAGGSLMRHDEDPKEPLLGLVKAHSRSESYHALFHETVWPQLSARKFLWCKSAWAMFDYTSDSTTSGSSQGYNDMGLVSGDRSVRKDAFFYYKAQWSAQPVLHITDRRFAQRQSKILLKLYANVADVRVRVNGNDLPVVTGAGGVYRWPDVQLSPGENVVEATGMSANGPVQDRVTWTVTANPE